MTKSKPNKFWPVIAISLLAVAILTSLLAWITLFMNLDSVFACSFVAIGKNRIQPSWHFTSIYQHPKKIDVRKTINALEQAFDYSFWMISHNTKSIPHTTACFYSDKESLLKILGSNLPFEPAAFYLPTKNSLHFGPLPQNPAFEKAIIYHEVMHFVLDNYITSNQAPQPPHWFLEGLSEYISEKYTKPLINDYKQATLKSHLAWENMSQNYSSINETYQPDDFYNQSYLIIKFLADTYGQDIIPQIISTSAESKITIFQALESNTGKSISQLETDWQQWLKK